MNDLISTLEQEFSSNSNQKIAIEQKAYMRDQFDFFGIKTTERREITKPFLIKNYLPEKEKLSDIIKILWNKPQRDFHYFGQELVFKYIKQFEKKDIQLIEFMIRHNSWWDTVDFISAKLAGAYFKKFPNERDRVIKQWLESENIWLQRSTLLFQLKYKNDLDPEFLKLTINHLLGSNEFFINKAIGWILREYSKTNPEWVLGFANNTKLSNLSKKEALRLIK